MFTHIFNNFTQVFGGISLHVKKPCDVSCFVYMPPHLGSLSSKIAYRLASTHLAKGRLLPALLLHQQKQVKHTFWCLLSNNLCKELNHISLFITPLNLSPCMDTSSKYQLNWYSLIYPQNYMKNYKNIVCPLNLTLKPLLSASSKPIYTSTYYPLIICKENPLTASYYFSIFDLSTERCFFKY